MNNINHASAQRCHDYLMVTGLSLCVMCSSVLAEEAPNDDRLFYYKIGGGRNIAIPPSLNITTIDFSLNAQASALSCSGFDPMVAIESSMDNIKNGLDSAVNAIELAAAAAIANLPGYIL